MPTFASQTTKRGVRRGISTFADIENLAKIAQLVEHDLAKVGVAGSSPVFRSQNSSFKF